MAANRNELKFPQDNTANSYAVEHAHALDPLAPFLRNAPWLKGPAGGLGFQPENPSRGTSTDDTSTGEEMTGKMRKMPIPRQASPTPPIHVDLEAQSSETETTVTIESRRWRVRGQERNTVPGMMKLNIKREMKDSDSLWFWQVAVSSVFENGGNGCCSDGGQPPDPRDFFNA